MNAKRVVANLIADGWTPEAAKAATKLLTRYESTLPLPGLVKLGQRLIDSLRRAA